MNNLQDLITLLNNAILQGGGNLTLPLANLPESATLVGYLQVDSVIINNAKLTATTANVTVAGQISIPSLKLANVQATLTGQVENQTALLQLKAYSFPSGWNFTTSFPNLPQSEDFDSSKGTYFFKNSYLGELVLTNPFFTVSTFADAAASLVQGLNFSSGVGVTGPFQQIAHLISSVKLLTLYGGITLQKTDPPIFALRADLSSFNFNLGQIKMTDVHLTLTTEPPADSDEVWTSSLGIAGTIAIGTAQPITMVISSALQNTGIWIFQGVPVGKSTQLSNGLADLAPLISGSASDLQIPTIGKVFSLFFLSEISVTLSAIDNSVQSIFVSVTSTDPWVLPLPGFTINQISTGWNVMSPLDSAKRSITGYVSGIFVFGQEQVGLQVTALVPDFTVFAALQELDTPPNDNQALVPAGDPPAGIHLRDVLTTLTGSDGGIPDFIVTQFDLMVDPKQSSYSLDTAVYEDWTLPVKLGQTSLTFERMTFSIAYSQTALSGKIAAYFTILDTDFIVSAEKPAGDNGWIFSGAMAQGQQLTLQTLATGFLPADWSITLPRPLDTLALTELAATINTKDNTYSLAAGFTWEIADLVPNYTFEIDASFALQSSRNADQSTSYSGSVSGQFKVNSLTVTVSYQFQSNNNTLSFAINFRGTTLSCSYATKTVAGNTQKVLTVSIGNLNVGEMIEYLVNLADPASNFKLTAPWDVLNDISMKNLTLEINLTTNAVSLAYTPGSPIDLLIIKLNYIKLTYVKKVGQGTVDIELGGNFLGQDYNPNNPLKWDLLNDQPPATPGAGAALLDLEYLGLGQHIALDTTGLNNVTQVINALEAMLQPVEDASQNPLAQLKGLSFSQNSNWLIGTKFTVMGTVTIAVIFNDPQVYGLLIALGGEKAKSFAGLQFEILYKKVTDTIGVYHIELKLPDAMRHLEFGAVSVTLPLIVLDIFTNGNFKVDFGFPWNGNFSRSFAVQVFPFVGYGGFYFAYLNGDTSTSVPKITNGNFNPVIEFGLGLSLGVGKTINEGVLSAGASLTVQGILQGVLGWFNPNDSALPKEMYYWIQGTITLVGKVYGSVDFVVVSASFSVTAIASATLTIEAYQPILISLSAGVSVSASIKILFIRIHFSFSMTINLSFTIGHASPTPWIVDPAGGKQLPQPKPMLANRMVLRAAARDSLSLANAFPPLNWTPVNVLNGATYNLQMFLVPAFTVAVPECSPNLDLTPQVQAVMLPFVENSLPTAPVSSKEIRTVASDAANELPFNRLAHALLLWSINALTQNINLTITEDGLQHLYEQMTADDASDSIFAVQGSTIYQNLSAFIGKNFTFQITGTADSSQTEMSATIFPIMPDLTMTAGAQATIDFSIFNSVDQTYETDLANYFKERLANAEANNAQDPLTDPNLALSELKAGSEPAKESLATVIFKDYFFMLAKAGVQAALDALKSYQYPVQPNDELQGIVGKFPARATSVVQIAAANRDIKLHAGTLLPDLGLLYGDNQTPVVKYQIKSGDTLSSIAAKFNNNSGIVAQNAANDTIFQASSVVTYPASTYSVESGDTLDFIAAYYLVRNLETGNLRDLRWFTQTIIDNNNQIDFRLPLTVGATLQIPQFTINPQGMVVLGGSTPYTVQTGDTLQAVAERNFANLAQSLNLSQLSFMYDPEFGWLQQSILQLSQASNPNVDFTGVLPTGTTLTIPQVVLTNEGVVQKPDTFLYKSRQGDTLDLVTGYFLLTQLEQSLLAPVETNIRNANPGVNLNPLPATIKLPLLQHQITPVDSFALLEILFGASVDVGAANNQSVSLLAPLAILDIPSVTHTIVEGETLTTIAATYDFTVEDLGEMIATVANVFVPSTETATSTITIPSLQEINIQDLLTYLLAMGDFNNMAAMVSRFMLHGMRIPQPPPPNAQLRLSIQDFKAGLADQTTLCPLYQMTGQQFTAPQTITEDFEITFLNQGQASWIEFSPTTNQTLTADETLAQIAENFKVPPEQIVALNPNVDFTKPVAQGTVLVVPANQLVITLTSDTVKDYPSTTFSPAPSGPFPMPLLQEVPVRYTLTHNYPWQVPDNSLFGDSGNSSQLAGQPNLWLLPDNLTSKIEGLSGPKPFVLQTGTYTTGAVMQTNPVRNYYWATALKLNVRRLFSEATRAAIPGSYLVLGADEAGNDLLREVYNYLQTPNLQDAATLYLLYQPNPSSSNSKGLASDILDRSNTFILKTNLSTETHSGPVMLMGAREMILEAVAPESGEYFANIAASAEFLQFLWQASIVGTGGFYLNYATQGGGYGLPENVFSNGDDATLWLVILLGSQSNPNTPSRTLYPFNNCALVGDNLDTSKVNLFAEMEDGTDTNPYTTVAAGNIGFEMTRPNPDQLPESPTQLTQALYNLLGFEIIGDTLFHDSGEMPPVGPTEDDPTQTGGMDLPQNANTDDNTWRFQQIVPFYKFARQNPVPQVSGLPAQAENPYAGITKFLTGEQYNLGNVTFGFAFQDVYGNRTPPDHPIDNLPIAVGYFDTIIGLSQWPGTASSFQFTGQDGKPILNVEIGLDLSKYLPNSGNPYSSAIYSASSHQQRYKQLYYQVQQRQHLGQTQPFDLTFYLSTTMSQASQTALPARYEIQPRYLLTNFISSAYLFLNTSMWLRAYNHPVADGETLAKIAQTYFGALAGNDPQTLESLATANQNTPLAQILAGEIAIPNFYIVKQGDTLAMIAEATSLAVLQLANQNEAASLNATTVLSLPARTATLHFSDPKDNTLAKVAANQIATVGGLALANLSAANLLAPGTPVTYQGFTVKVGQTIPGQGIIETFADLANYFNTQIKVDSAPITAPDIAVANQNVVGIFKEGAPLTIADYVVQQGDTIQSVLKGFQPYPQITLEQLVGQVNQGVANFFAAGASLFWNTTTQTFSGTDTLVSVAAENHLTLQQLAFYNGATALQTKATLTIPNLVTIDPAFGPFYSFYEAVGSENFQQIAKLFNESVGMLAQDNQEQTGIFAPQQTIDIKQDNQTYTITTGAYDTFNSLLAAFAAKGLTISLADFATDIQAMPNLIARGALFTCQLPQLQATTEQLPVPTQSLAQIVANYQPAYVQAAGAGEGVSNLGLANSALKGFLQAGITVYPNQEEFNRLDAKGEHSGISLQTDANDTFVSLLTRFALETGVVTTIEQIVTANQDANTLVAPNAPFILPPIPAVINQAITAQFPDIIFPVAVKLEMERDPDLIDPEFKSASPSPTYDDVTGVELDRSTIAPRSSGAAGQALNLGAFATDFEDNAFKGLKIATGKAQSEDQSQSSVPPLWAVNFGTGGFSEFAIQSASPSFYAVKPLSTKLQSRANVAIQPYENGALGEARPINFQAIDLDVWVRDFLAAVDLFLTPGYAVPAYGLDPNHAAFSSVVESKGLIADAVSSSVGYILEQAETDNTALEAAQQALLQQLLINLSNAYATDSIIQYPVSIQSPLSDPKTTPRISGQPVSQMYTTGASDDLTTIAETYTVSKEYVAEILANATRILNPDARLSFNSQSATLPQIAVAEGLTTDQITLQIIAGYFKTTLNLLAENLSVSQGGGLFATNATLSISQVKKLLAATDSFENLAEYFNQTILSVALANQDLKGIFAVANITAGKQTVAVTANDSLSTVAQKFNPPLRAETLANEIASQTDLFNQQATLSMIQVVPDYTLSTAKTPLTNNGALLNFMFNTKAEALFKKLFFNLNFVMNEMEYDIQDGTSNISDYQASSWLSFIIPIDSTVSSLPDINSFIGQVEVPIPLRSYPTPPSLISQEGVTEFPQATTVEEAKMWNYQLTYERQDAAQDTDYLTVTFNTSSQDSLMKSALGGSSPAQLFDALFDALAQFTAVYPALKNDLAVLPTLKPGTPNQTALSAMNVFQQLVSRVATAWEALTNASTLGLRAGLAAGQGLIEVTYNFSLETTIVEGFLASLTVKPLDDQTTVLPANVYVYTTDKQGNVIAYQLTTNPAAEATAGVTEKTFFYPPTDGSGAANPVAATGSVKQIIEFTELDMVLTQNAWGGVYVTRNENLVSYATTSQSFIYQTPLARFSNMMVPLVQNTSCINITSSADPTDFSRNLTGSLNQVFSDLFAVDESKSAHNIKLACQYGYQLVSTSGDSNPCGNPDQPMTSLISRLPVLFIPKYPYSLNDPSYVAQIVLYITQWLASSQASTQGGFFIFEISLFSTLDPQLIQPLLEMKNLVYQPPAS